MRRLWVLALLALLSGLATCASRLDPGRLLHDFDCYLVQLHIHGLSNHNGNRLPASMESHSSEARRCNFDVIWWSDHARIFESYADDIKVRFRNARLNGDTLIFAKKRERALSRFAVTKVGKGCDISIDRASVKIGFTRLEEPCSERAVKIRLASARGKVHTLDFCRPVASGLKVLMWGDFSTLKQANSYLRFKVDLSWHPKGQHHLMWVFSGEKEGRLEVVGDTLASRVLPLDGSKHLITLDVEDLASNLPNGYDNTLSDVVIEFGTHACDPLSVRLDSLAIHSDRPQGENQYGLVEELARRYASNYGVTEYVGVELGLFHTPLLPHMNAFLPDSTRTFYDMKIWRGMKRPDWVELIHAKGGLVSFNHPFGASLRPRHAPLDTIPLDASPRRMWRSGRKVSESDFWRVAKPLLEHKALGADILEVGYLFRATGSLEDHLRLWDLALANGIKLVGDGVSDSHGGRWEPNMVPGDFATWIWARSKDADDIIQALRHGRVAFGDPFYWKGRFAFGIDNTLMGDTLHAQGSGKARAWILMDPPRSDVIVRLIQIEMRKAHDLSFVRQDTIRTHFDSIDVEKIVPSFVRIEVYDLDGNPLIFSNPVFILR